MEAYQSRPVDIKKKDLNVQQFKRIKKHFEQDDQGDYTNLEEEEIMYRVKLPNNQSAAIINKKKIKDAINEEKHFKSHYINLEKEHIFQFQYFLHLAYFEILEKDLPYLLFLGYEFDVQKLIKQILGYIKENEQKINLRLPLQQVQDVLFFYEYIDDIIQDGEDEQNNKQLETFLEKLLMDNPHLFKQDSIRQNQEIERCFRKMKIKPFKSLLEKNAELVIISDSENGRQTFDPENYLSIIVLKIEDKKKIDKFLQELEKSKAVLKDRQIKLLTEENQQIRQQLEEQKRLVAKQKSDYEARIKEIQKKLCTDYLSNNQFGNQQQQFQNGNQQSQQFQDNYNNQVQQYPNIYQHEDQISSYAQQNQYQNNQFDSQQQNYNQNFNQVQPNQVQQSAVSNQGSLKHLQEMEGCGCTEFITTANCKCQICYQCQAVYIISKKYKSDLGRYNQKCWACQKGVFTDQDYVEMK